MTHHFELIGAAFGKACSFSETSGAPRALRAAGLLNRLREVAPELVDGGDVAESADFSDYEPHPVLKNLPEVLAFSKIWVKRIEEIYQNGRKPLIIGGDHSISLGSIAAASNALKKEKGSDARLGLLWVDAHADINTESTTPSGNIHGMPVAALLGYDTSPLSAVGGPQAKLLPEDIVFVGLRDLDEGEKALIKEKNITAYTMTDVDRMGIGAVMEAALKKLRRNTSGFVASFDLDVCDPALTTAVGTPVRGGMTYREAHYVLESVHAESICRSIEFVEYNPALDSNGNSRDLSIALLESAAGKTIL